MNVINFMKNKHNNSDPFDFRKNSTLEKRKDESTRVRAKYPDRIPMICESAKNTAEPIILDRNKYLVPGDVTVGQFLIILRKRIKITPDKAIFLFTEQATLPPTSELISNIYKTHKNEDGFLYILVATETTFGSEF